MVFFKQYDTIRAQENKGAGEHVRSPGDPADWFGCNGVQAEEERGQERYEAPPPFRIRK